MKIRVLFLFFLSLLLTVGCASPPKRERAKLPVHIEAPTKPPLPPEEKLKELVVPQREEAKKLPEKLFSFSARDLNIQDALLALSRESNLNIVIDPEVTGKVTIDLKRVTLKEALHALLSPLGWTYRIDGNFIKVSRPQMETRFFTLNYTATKRTGKREVYASTSTGGGLQTSSLPGQQTALSPGSQRTGYTDLISVDEMDLWKEIHRGLEAIMFGSVEEKEKESKAVFPETEKTTWIRTDGRGRKLIVNKSTGVIFVTDYPINLNKIASYIETIEGSSQRQVTIQAKIMEVFLSDDYKEGINWQVIEGLPRSINLAWGLTDKAGTTGFPGGTGGFLVGIRNRGNNVILDHTDTRASLRSNPLEASLPLVEREQRSPFPISCRPYQNRETSRSSPVRPFQPSITRRQSSGSGIRMSSLSRSCRHPDHGDPDSSSP